MNFTTKNRIHPCSSCDKPVSEDEMDTFGRCQECQEEYGDIEEE